MQGLKDARTAAVQPEGIDARTARPLPRDGRRPGLGRLLAEPLVQFLALGLLLFAAAHWRDVERQRRTIDVGPAVLQDLSTKYRAQFGAAPDPTTLRALRDAYVQEEIYYREGVALGLDRNDQIVRRRVAQKYAFLSDDVENLPAPSAAMLQDYFRRREPRYREPPRTLFEQVYFAGEGGAARARAAAALIRLRAGRRVTGEEFPGPQSTGAMSADEIERLFGRSEISQVLPALAPGGWSGPYKSGYGWHLVRVRSRMAGRTPAFADLQDTVLRDYRAEQERAAGAERYRRLLARYHIVGVEPRG